jgi:DNA-binding NarL/FixJ family response regulator
VISVPSVQAWKEISDNTSASLILLWASAHRSLDDVQQDLKNLCEMPNPVPAVVVSDTDNVDHVLDSLENGARGYIPVNLSFDIAVEAMRFVKAGGTFVPANMLLMAQRSGRSLNQDKPEAEFFTSRQAAVIEALRMGKPNKSIAYELNMCESTVKVHVRNIMKKLKAKNRTEVAFMANKMLR